MTLTRRLLCAGGALMMAATLGRCDNTPSTPPDGGMTMNMPDMAAAPTVTLVSPASAPNTGGTLVTLTGTNFKPGATVTFNDIPATQVTVVSSTEITCVVPAKPATCAAATIVVKNTDGGMVTNSTLFKYRSSMLSFANVVSYAMGSRPRQAITADVNGDGNLDLITVNSTSANVSVRLGMGDGSFGPVTNVDVVAGSPYAVAAVDVNGDNQLDLVTVHNNSNNVRIRLNMGNGTFMAPAQDSFNVGAGPYDIAAADLDGDGDRDLVVANNGSSNVSILINNGSGVFMPANPPTAALTGTTPVAIILADMNGDQRPDFATANSGGTMNHVTTRLGNGTGGFLGTTGGVSGPLTSPTDLVAGDA